MIVIILVIGIFIHSEQQVGASGSEVNSFVAIPDVNM